MTTPTRLIYIEDFDQLTAQATILAIQKQEENPDTNRQNRFAIILDQTVFYAQGGGQPYDTGFINLAPNQHTNQNSSDSPGNSDSFEVQEVWFEHGIVRHVGVFTSEHAQESFNIGQTVTCEVNQERRLLNSRLHAAGHVIDKAVDALGLTWLPAKAFHFPVGPNVEYVGVLPVEGREELAKQIETKANEFIAADEQVALVFMPKDQMSKVCRNVPENIPSEKPARVVMYGDFGIPCGGTHVKHLGIIKGVIIRKIKPKGDTLKVSYDVV